MKDNDSLAVKYLEYMDREDRGETFNDFFNWVKLPLEQRSDFVVGAIIKQAVDIYRQKGIPS